MITLSLVAAATTFAFGSTAGDIADLQAQIDKLKTKQGKINAQSANDNIKWGVDFRTAYDNINYDMADGSTRGNDSLLSMRLWLNMAYAADEHNIFKGQLSMNKAFGADFGEGQSSTTMNRALSMGGMFDWTGNEALTDNSLKVRQAYWLYLGDEAFGADIPWTMSIGRRPSTNGFLSNLSQDDAAGSPLAHVINVEFDGLSSKLDLSNVTGVPGMSFKVCLGYGSTNAAPMFDRLDGTQYSTDETEDALDDIKLGGFIFEPYNDGQYIVKVNWFRAFDLPGFDSANFLNAFGAADMGAGKFSQNGNMDGAAISVLIDGLTDDGYMSDVKLFGSFAWSNTNPDEGAQMLGVTAPNYAYGLPNQPEYMTMGAEAGESQSGTSYWFGAYLPITDGSGENFGTIGLEYNHGSEYWRPFTYAEDTMIGSKIAARGDAFEANYTYQINDALSFQARYVAIDYEYTGSNSFFGSDGTPIAIDDIQSGAAGFDQVYAGALQGGMISDPTDPNAVFNGMVGAVMMQGADQATAINQVQGMTMMKGFSANVVDKAQDFRMYLRYRF